MASVPGSEIAKPVIRRLPRLYPILDIFHYPDVASWVRAAEELIAAGVSVLQYRNKSGNPRQILDQACKLRRHLHGSVTLIMNDRADLCLAAGFDGVHVGQEDLSPDAVRRIVGPGLWMGVSTHNPGQLREADKTSATYLAVGPIFSTTSKANPDPVVGLDGVRKARSLTVKPLVAIGGITRANCRAVIEAGADSVAVISDLLSAPGKSAEEFLQILR
jgi:thiamine-phosphate pyrophosphorylase